ncbi:N-acetylgalactosamine kinase-like [Lingula anatina]|uniref:N-acetylgalactosamine kinase-like n=1 Tax=Lingula anatina TaxID=7574 RepID=A0A1S3JN61_LINAN|nr:N-acetylgalactosamine kinase-like [Lingula anatina]|eukprot:XP_013411807.1 N-acetylgalactosamine kinase-like [Lingula anatina]
MAKEKGLNWREIKKLGDLQKTLGITLEDAIKLTQSVLHPEPYSKEEVCNILGVSAEELAQTSLSQNTLTVASFKLHDRATHVYSEAKRVWDFKKICDEQPHNASEMLGQLMNDSHTSCRDLYECSCPDLDHLVDLCIQSGALGSRLTGAGWGGCAVSMVPADCVQEFITMVQQRYYAKDPAREARVKESLFATVPGSGAVIYKWDD